MNDSPRWFVEKTILEGIQREARNVRVARDIMRVNRKAAADAVKRGDPVWAENYRAQAAKAWAYAKMHRAELIALQARKAAAGMVSQKKQAAA